MSTTPPRPSADPSTEETLRRRERLAEAGSAQEVREEQRALRDEAKDEAKDESPEDKLPGLLRGFAVVHAALGLLFALMALLLMAIAAREAWAVLDVELGPKAAQMVIEAVGVLAAAVVALQIAQTIVEEEVIRSAHISAPTRVRRFLSRFMVVVVVALAIEALVATFRASHEDSTLLLHAAAMVFAVGVLLGGWGLFIHLNRSAEELEPEAMREAKREDHKLK